MKIRKNGFTLIEVILVLAVGSLIFAMAFLAYGQASINRRDTQRRADLGKIASELENFASDNNGKYPQKQSFGSGTYDSFVTDYIATLKDPSSGLYYKDIERGTSEINDSSSPGHLSYFPQFFLAYDSANFCDGSPLPSGNRDYVIRMKLEKGEACRDSKQ